MSKTVKGKVQHNKNMISENYLIE